MLLSELENFIKVKEEEPVVKPDKVITKVEELRDWLITEVLPSINKNILLQVINR